MKKKAISKIDDTAELACQKIEATRMRWDQGVEMVTESLTPAIRHLNALVADLRSSPLGRTAKQNPLASLAIGSVAALLVSRLLRR